MQLTQSFEGIDVLAEFDCRLDLVLARTRPAVIFKISPAQNIYSLLSERRNYCVTCRRDLLRSWTREFMQLGIAIARIEKGAESFIQELRNVFAGCFTPITQVGLRGGSQLSAGAVSTYFPHLSAVGVADIRNRVVDQLHQPGVCVPRLFVAG